AFMHITRSSALLAFALLFAFASTVCAAGPQPSILGPGGSPFGGYDPNVMTMSTCGGPIGSGWGAYGGAGWKVAQQFIPTITDVALGVRIGCSMNGFTSFTLTGSVYTDAGGGIPGTLLFTSAPVTVNNPPPYPSATAVN